MIVLRVVAFVAGACIVYATLASALRTTVLPRGVPARIGRVVFRSVRVLFLLRIGKRASYEKRDRIMAFYAPTALMILLATWLGMVALGFFLMYLGIGVDSWRDAFLLTGSIFTLGFERPPNLAATVLVYVEAALGLGILALLITYLPSIYQGFSRREAFVTSLEIRAGVPPTGATMLTRFFVLGRLERLSDEVWTRGEMWFADIEESHTSFPALAFFRAPTPDRSWVTAAGAILDAAALYDSTLDVERDVQSNLCIRAGYVALRRICDFFRLAYDPAPQPDAPISISREEYDAVCDRFAEAGLPVRADREQSWRDFAGWRVNYDAPLLSLAVLTDAPPAPWSSDGVAGTYRDLLAQRRGRRSQG